MERTRVLGTLWAVAGVLLLAGCRPQQTRTRPPWTNPLDALEQTLVQDPQDNDYMLCRMEFGRRAILYGSYWRAGPRLREAFDQMGSEHENVAAALSTERLKYYKGETYERAMLATYLGYVAYLEGDYNTARIFLSRALSADRTAVVKENTPRIVGEDFGLTYYWLARVYDKLGDRGNTAVAYKKAKAKAPRKEAQRELKDDRHAVEKSRKRRTEGEQWAYETFCGGEKAKARIDGVVNLADPDWNTADAATTLSGAAPKNPVVRAAKDQDEFFSRDYQDGANLILTIEVGRCPWKSLAGLHAERTEFQRPHIAPRSVQVYVDGHRAGGAFEVLDLWNQAATQDRIGEKDAAQASKAVAKEILSHMPYAGSLAGHWDVTGDVRHWTSLPGKVFLYAAKLAPGTHTIRLAMFDVNGELLPRWSNTYYGIHVPAEGEACVLLNPRFGGDNQLTPEQRKQALDAGAKPWSGM